MIVTTVARPGWVAVQADDVDAVIEASNAEREGYAAAAARGLVPLLEALATQGLADLPSFAICDRSSEPPRALLRGDGILRADGEPMTAEGRLPWREVESTASSLELTGVARLGWRRPSRFEGGVTKAHPTGPEVAAPLAAPPPPSPSEVPPAARPFSVPAATSRLSSLPWRRPSAPIPPAMIPPIPGADGAGSPPPAHTDTPPPFHADTPPPPPPPQERVPAQADPDAGTAPPATEPARTRSPVDLSPSADGPQVLSVRCPQDHLSPPNLPSCTVCGSAIAPQEPQLASRPPLGVLVISTGGVVPLDRGVLLGRTPTIDRSMPPMDRPHLVRLAGLDNDISRNHAEVRLEGWRVLVRDLGSTNGTAVIEATGRRLRLQPHADHPLEPGATIELADRVSLTYSMAE